ncbi:hypothetical protein ACRAVF_27060 [Bradyrhizobium oligotrophicum S58]
MSDRNLLPLLSLALADVLVHCAMSFRPICDGVPVPPEVVAHALLPMVARASFDKIARLQHGLEDYAIPFQRGEDGQLHAIPFDFTEHLTEKP